MSQPPDKEFSGKRILITGATGSIGRATALRLSEVGAHVVLNGRDAGKLEKSTEGLPEGSFTLAPFDLNSGDEISAWLREITEKKGAFAGIAHTAGVQVMRPLRSITSELIASTLHINVTTPIMLGKAFRQRGCHTDGASLVLVSSTAYFIGGGANTPYAASKAAVVSITKAMALELLRDKMRVNCVVPGLVESDMSERARAITPAESWKTVLSGYPMGIGCADDIAYAIIHLLSEKTKWMTGAELQIDGGLSIV